MLYVDYVYDIVKNETKGMDAIYEDFIIHLVGYTGLTELRENKLVEYCGSVHGRSLLVLCDKPEVKPDIDYVEMKKKIDKLRNIILNEL